LTQTIVTMAVYRLWACKASGVDISMPACSESDPSGCPWQTQAGRTVGSPWYLNSEALSNFGVGAVDPMASDYSLEVAAALAGDGDRPNPVDLLRGGRDYWFKRGHPRPKRHRFPHLAASDYGTAQDPTCSLPAAPLDAASGAERFNLTHGELDSGAFLPTWARQHSTGAPLVSPADTRFPYKGLELRVTWDPNKAQTRTFATYHELKAFVVSEFAEQRLRPARAFVDPYIYDLYRAVMLVEEYGEELPGHVDVSLRLYS
jgi:hypothetical protein